MRYAVGLMACIAIAFLTITSPDSSRSQATPVASASPAACVACQEVKAEVAHVVGGCDCECDKLELRVKELEGRVTKLESAKPAVVAAPVKVAAQPPVAKPKVVQSRNYTPRWHNYDGRTPRQHRVEVHGFDPNLSDDELARLHDAYHDRYGAHPPTAVARSVVSQPARSVSRVVTKPYVSVRSSGDCPGGVCPTRQTVRQSSGGVLGFGVFGRR